MIQSTKIKVKKLSKKLGLKEQIVLEQAVSLLWGKVESVESLKGEIKQWEKLSDELWQKIKD